MGYAMSQQSYDTGKAPEFYIKITNPVGMFISVYDILHLGARVCMFIVQAVTTATTLACVNKQQYLTTAQAMQCWNMLKGA